MRCARLSGMFGTALPAIVALGALPAGAGTSSFGSVVAAQAPGCVPVPGTVCGSVRVPLFRSISLANPSMKPFAAVIN